MYSESGEPMERTTGAQRLARSFAVDLQPAAERFLAGDSTSAEFRSAVSIGYERTLAEYDLELSTLLQRPYLEAQGIWPAPEPDKTDAAEILSQYPASITGHNLIRLADVLVADTGGGYASQTELPERLTDLEETISRLASLLEPSMENHSKEQGHD